MSDAITGPSTALRAGSLQDRLRAAKQEQHQQEHSLAIPGYSGQLVARYRSLDWRERRQIGLTVNGPDLVDKELNAAADLLVKSCVGVDAHVDGEIHPLNMTLGAELASFLGEEGAETDRQGVFLIFPSELLLMTHLEELSEMQSGDDEVGKA